MKNKDILEKIFNRYKLNDVDRNTIYRIIENIIKHSEFQKRFSNEFLHHGDVSLSEHILEDTVVTYLLSKKSKKKIDLELILKISMMHDLYTTPWQNNTSKKKKIIHKHGFSHPIEAIVNSLNWFPEEFKDEEKARVIIDGVIHHMFPFPVLSFKKYNFNKLELYNYDLIKNIDEKYIRMIEESSNRNRIFGVSFSKSLYNEGRLMSKADKKSSLNQLNHLSDFIALFTGKNKRIKK